MEKVSKNNAGKLKTLKGNDDDAPKVSFIGSLIEELLIEPTYLTALTNLNLMIVCAVGLALVAGYNVNLWYILFYFPLIYLLSFLRKSRKEKHRLAIAHRIPHFADALANALSLGTTLEQAFKQAAFYLKGKIKVEMNLLVLKNALGRNLGDLVRELDTKFPHTGLIYLVSLLDAYTELGVGISPLLKKISVVLAQKEKAEEKIRTILSAGSGYARLSIVVFAGIFSALAYLLKDQVKLLLSPGLKPIFIFFCVWTGIGILIVTRITSLDFARTFALRPYIKEFVLRRKLNTEDLLNYSGVEWTSIRKKMLLGAPIVTGLLAAYLMSLYNGSSIVIMIGFLLGALISWIFIKYTLKGMLEDELIKIVEVFPEILQVFNIGLNSGLNIYLAFQFAENAVRANSPKLLNEELTRTKFAIECGEEPAKTWQRLAERLPFETVVDFCDIMVVAPMHGESIVNSIAHMITSYQEKKLSLIEKKATSLSQLVIPIIIAAFFPLFLFVVFAPLITKITNVF